LPFFFSFFSSCWPPPPPSRCFPSLFTSLAPTFHQTLSFTVSFLPPGAHGG
jgi:hypothetical protein